MYCNKTMKYVNMIFTPTNLKDLMMMVMMMTWDNDNDDSNKNNNNSNNKIIIIIIIIIPTLAKKGIAHKTENIQPWRFVTVKLHVSIHVAWMLGNGTRGAIHPSKASQKMQLILTEFPLFICTWKDGSIYAGNLKETNKTFCTLIWNNFYSSPDQSFRGYNQITTSRYLLLSRSMNSETDEKHKIPLFSIWNSMKRFIELY